MKKSLFQKVAAVLSVLILMSGMIACESKPTTSTATPTIAATSAPTKAPQTSPSAMFQVPKEAVFTSNGEAKVTVDGTKFIVNNKPLWINGVNTPWNVWNDFGVFNFNKLFWEDHFAKLEAAGVNASRVWINCSGMAGVILNTDGSFKQVTVKQWKDLDEFFAIAEKHHIYIMATLLSFDHFKESNDSYQNWRKMITSSKNIDSFVDGYVIPFVKRYDKCDYLWSVDLMNEPDWVFENQENGKIAWKNLSNYFSRASAGIHENSDVLVTVGIGVVKYNSDKVNKNVVSDKYLQKLSGNKKSYLDFYSTHYYFWQNPWFGYPFEESPKKFGLDGTKPCMIGEVASLDESGRTITQKYEGAYKNGWNGVMAWTSNGVDKCGGYEAVEPAIKKMFEQIPDLIHPLK